jgi:hypothetical protein
MLVRHFQIAFGFKADGTQSALTRGTPEEKHVGEFSRWDHREFPEGRAYYKY